MAGIIAKKVLAVFVEKVAERVDTTVHNVKLLIEFNIHYCGYFLNEYLIKTNFGSRIRELFTN